MTDVLTRPTSASAGPVVDVADPSIWGRGALGALWATSVGVASLVVLSLVVWASDSRSGASAGAAIRTALQLWLVAQRVPLRLHLHSGTATFALAPLLLTALLWFLVARAAASLARSRDIDGAPGVGLVALAVGLPYAVLTTFVAAAAHASTVQPSPAAALGCGLLAGVGAAGWGAARGTGRMRALLDPLPDWLRSAVLAGAASTAVLVLGAMLVVLVAVGLHGAEFGDGLHALGGGAVALTALVLLDLALLPNAAMSAIGYFSGTGFAVGAHTTVSLSGVQQGTLPALPLLVVVPTGSAGPVTELVALGLLVAAGVTAAWIVARAGRPLLPSTGAAAAAGAVVGVLVALLAAHAGGPAGPGAMAVVGTSSWQTGLAITAEVAVVACGAVGAMTWRRGR
jgi:hypothetical protein